MKITRETQTMARRLIRWCMVNGVLDESRIRRVAGKLGSGKLRNKLALLVAFTNLVKIHLGRRMATIQSAVPLTEEEKDRITRKLETRYGQGLTYDWSVDPGLIAGIRVKVSDDVSDGTVKARIASLERLTQQ